MVWLVEGNWVRKYKREREKGFYEDLLCKRIDWRLCGNVGGLWSIFEWGCRMREFFKGNDVMRVKWSDGDGKGGLVLWREGNGR